MHSSASPGWDVDRYQSQHSFVWEYGSSLIEILDPQPNERILDVGCGSGELTNAIAEKGSIAIGFDADASMVKRAKEQFPDVKLFFQADAASFEMPSGEEPVDAIFSNAALHWVNDADSAAKQMSRALKAGGRFVVEFGGKGNVDIIVRSTLKVMDRPLSDNPWYFPSISQYSTLLEANGIEVTSAILFDRPTPLENGQDGLKNWLRMFGGNFFKDKSPQDIECILNQVDSNMRKADLLWKKDRWIADYRRIRIIGRKLEEEDA